SRAAIFFTAFQITSFLSVIVFVKSTLQGFEWYAYQPNAWMHPRALEIQGSVLGFICLAWIALRVATPDSGLSAQPQFAGSRVSARDTAGKLNIAQQLKELSKVLPLPLGFDHLVAHGLLISFGILVGYGTMTGIAKELAPDPALAPVRDLATFSHQIVFGSGGWVFLALLLLLLVRASSLRGWRAFVLRR